MHDRKDLKAIVLVNAVDDSVGKMQESAFPDVTFDSTIHQRISTDASNGILERFQETLLQAKLSLLVERGGFIHFLESFWMKPVQPHEYFF
jgi:hypothetical protein